MSCIPHSIEFQVDVVVLGFLLALGFFVAKTICEAFEHIIFAILDLFKWFYDKAKSRKHPKN